MGTSLGSRKIGVRYLLRSSSKHPTDFGAHSSSDSVCTWGLLRRKAEGSAMLTAHIHSVQKLRVRGAVPLSPVLIHGVVL
jgi:hypothetical protein